mmetsp:Transcript_67512/g.133888  ORF Transcript_67512/g.133888 Transcript_67512/m.133888 type:complete len:298 (-) Transcript_67512:60-953(-)
MQVRESARGCRRLFRCYLHGRYAECFATDEERALVLSVKIPSHSNLAACSYRLGNFQHAVVHCTQVIEHEKRIDAAVTAKAFFRRGCSQMELGNLSEAKTDLKRALSLAPADTEVRRALTRLQARRQDYTDRNKEMTKRMLMGAGSAADDEVGGSEEEAGEAAGEEAEQDGKAEKAKVRPDGGGRGAAAVALPAELSDSEVMDAFGATTTSTGVTVPSRPQSGSRTATDEDGIDARVARLIASIDEQHRAADAATGVGGTAAAVEEGKTTWVAWIFANWAVGVVLAAAIAAGVLLQQ